MAQGSPYEEHVPSSPVEPNRERVPEGVRGGRLGPTLVEPVAKPPAGLARRDRPAVRPREHGPRGSAREEVPQVLPHRRRQEHSLGAAALHMPQPHLAGLEVEVLDLQSKGRPEPADST